MDEGRKRQRLRERGCHRGLPAFSASLAFPTDVESTQSEFDPSCRVSTSKQIYRVKDMAKTGLLLSTVSFFLGSYLKLRKCVCPTRVSIGEIEEENRGICVTDITYVSGNISYDLFPTYVMPNTAIL